VILDITWRLGPAMPAALKGHAQGAIRQGMIVYCGTQFEMVEPGALRKGSATALGRKGWCFDTAALNYVSLPDAPLGVKWGGGAVLGDTFHLLTGMVAETAASPRVFALSRSSTRCEWSELPALAVGRFIPGIGVLGRTIYVIGGEALSDRAAPSATAQVTVDAVEAFDTTNPAQGWVRLPPLPGLTREAMAIAGISSTLYVFGGLHITPPDSPQHQHETYRPCADAYAYDARRGAWTRLPDPPFACYGWQASAWEDRRIVLTAGVRSRPNDCGEPERGLARPNHDVIVYDTATMTYRQLPTQVPRQTVLPAPPDMAESYSDPGQRERAAAYVAAVREVSKTIDLGDGGFRISPGLSLIGNVLYMAGGECLTPHAGASDDLLIGTIVADAERA
jgi:hypothetical protein